LSSWYESFAYALKDIGSVHLVSEMKNQEMGTIMAEGTARMPQMVLKEKPASKEPLYSLEFMPKPTSRIDETEPSVRVR